MWLAVLAVLAATLVPSSATTPRGTKAGGGAQLERGHQESSQGLLVADAEPGDGHVVGELAVLANYRLQSCEFAD